MHQHLIKVPLHLGECENQETPACRESVGDTEGSSPLLELSDGLICHNPRRQQRPFNAALAFC